MQYFISHYNKESEISFPEDFIIYDTTLRDGEQTPGVCFSFEEKLEIARKLDQFKINQIEAGFPIVSEKEREAVKAIASEDLNAEILALTRTKPEDIDAAQLVKMLLIYVKLQLIMLKTMVYMLHFQQKTPQEPILNF